VVSFLTWKNKEPFSVAKIHSLRNTRKTRKTTLLNNLHLKPAGRCKTKTNAHFYHGQSSQSLVCLHDLFEMKTGIFAVSALSLLQFVAAHPAPSPSSAPAPSSTGSPSGLGICYSPYNSDGTCKTQDQVNSDFNSLSGYPTVRIYGVDCNQISTVVSAASSKSIHVFAGLLAISDVAGDLGSMIKQLNGKFDGTITTISIGNELVDFGKASPADVVTALGTAREILGKAGYKGQVVTVDTFNALIAHPELCTASDYCAANAHAFFDGTIEAAGAGAWIQKQVGRIADAVGGGKEVVITESGWPHAGGNNGVAVPSPENQKTALESIRGAFNGSEGLFLFTAFDDKWKADGKLAVEKYWGVM